MNTLQQLNTLGGTPYEFTDGRAAGVIFDRTTPTNKEVTTSQNTTHSLPVGIEIEEVINYASAAVSYQVNVSAVSGATVTWPTVPSGCTVTNPSTGVYIISGINTAATWDIVRSPTVLSPSGFNNDFWQYSATITYNSTSTKVWYVGVYVGTVTVLTTPSAYVYTAASSNSVTGYPQIQYPGSAPTWTVTVTPELIDAVTTLSSAGAGGTSTFNSTTKVLTLVGTKTQVNSHLAALSVTTVANKQWSYNLTYVATNNTDIATATKTQAWSNTDYAILSVTRGNETYLVNTNANINNGPLVASTAAGTFSLDIVPTDTAGVSLLTTATGETIFRSPSNSSPDSFNFGYSISSSSTYDYFVIGCPGLTVNDGCLYVYKNGNIMARIPAPGAPPTTSDFGKVVAINDNADTIATGYAGYVYIYTRTNNVWSLQTNINLTYAISDLDFASNGNTLVIGLPAGDRAQVYTRSGTTWSNAATISTPSGSGALFGNSVSISNDGTYIAVGEPNKTVTNPYVGSCHVYTGSGSSWSLQATLTPSDTQIDQAFGFSVSLDSDGNTLVVGAPTTQDASLTSNKAATYVFTRSGTTWTEQTRITKDVSSYFRFGYAVDVSGDGTYLVSSNPGNDTNRGAVYKYQYTTSWGLVNTYTTSTTNQKFGNDCALGYNNQTYVGTNITSGSDYAYVYAGATAATYSPPTYSTQAADRYGYASALSGDGTYLAISKQGKDVNGVYNTGSVYIYTRIGNAWTLQTEIYPTNVIISSSFGISLSFNDDATYLAIGASTSDVFGAAYIFTRSGTTWTEQAMLTTASYPGTQAVSTFGASVSINSNGTYLAVGYYNDTPGSVNQGGSVIMFTRSGSTWTQQQQIIPSTQEIGEKFGNSVSINSDATYLAIGAYSDDNSGGVDAGSVYIFTRSGTTWTQQTRLQASDAATLDYFGTSVSINSDGTYVAVGSELDDNSAASNAGSVYIFTRSGTTWTQQTRLQASDGGVTETFGNNVALNGLADILVVTAKLDNLGAAGQGSAYVFKRSGTTWTQGRKITASDTQLGDQFGSSVALSTDGATLVIGAWAEDTGGDDAGSAYGYFVSDLFETWNDTTKTLTITGTQDFINTSIDLITLQPSVGYDKNYQLLYTVITPSATTASRSQRITRA